MSERRNVIRQMARERRAKRRDLVHAAGCALPDCCVRRAVFDDLDIVNEACADGIRIPRNVARHWRNVDEEIARRLGGG